MWIVATSRLGHFRTFLTEMDVKTGLQRVGSLGIVSILRLSVNTVSAS